MFLREKDVDALCTLWRELAGQPAGDGRASRDRALRFLGRSIGADRVWWVVSKRSRWNGRDSGRLWEPVDTYHLDGTEDDRVYAALIRQRYEADDRALFYDRRRELGPDPCQATRPCDVMTEREWYRDWYFPEARRPRGLDEVMVGTCAFDRETRVHVGIDRTVGAPPFDERSRDLLRLFLGGSYAWLREQLLAGGWIAARRPLTPRERDVASALLTDASEKEIADRLGLTPRTVHQYVTAVLRRFGVSGRAGLTALWLRYRR